MYESFYCGAALIMSHVSALPRTSSASVLEESAAGATQFALATLESFPSLFEGLDAGDAAVGVLGVAVAARAAFSVASASGSLGSAAWALARWSPLRWLSFFRKTTP